MKILNVKNKERIPYKSHKYKALEKNKNGAFSNNLLLDK